MKHIFKYFTPALFLLFLLDGSSCKKTNNCNNVPNVSVYFTTNLTTTGVPLNAVGNNETFSGGDAGVMVYHYTANNFTAYDCMCPYDGATNAKAVITASQGSLFATCPVCGSSYQLSTGSPNKGPSGCPLKAYSAYYDGSSTITVQSQ